MNAITYALVMILLIAIFILLCVIEYKSNADPIMEQHCKDCLYYETCKMLDEFEIECTRFVKKEEDHDEVHDG